MCNIYMHLDVRYGKSGCVRKISTNLTKVKYVVIKKSNFDDSGFYRNFDDFSISSH